MSSKPSKQNTNTTGNLNVELKFDDDADEDKPKTWIYKEGFDEFESEYRESQDDSSLANTSSVEFEIHVQMVKVETKKEETKKIWSANSQMTIPKRFAVAARLCLQSRSMSSKDVNYQPSMTRLHSKPATKKP